MTLRSRLASLLTRVVGDADVPTIPPPPRLPRFDEPAPPRPRRVVPPPIPRDTPTPTLPYGREPFQTVPSPPPEFEP